MKYLLPVCFVFFYLQACTSQSEKINGVSFVASGEPALQQNVDAVLNVHANYAAVMPFGFVRDLETPQLKFNSDRQWYGEREEGVQQYIELLHKNNISVMLKPQIWISRGEFTGYLKMTSEADWNLLEQSYKDFILLYASLASELDVAIYCIGTELEQFIVHRPEFWKELISEVKTVYDGKLTYAANWDEYKRVPFWNELDYIGVDGYFPVSDMQTPTVTDATLGWQPWKLEMKKLSTTYNKPILFTEYGYRSIDYSGKEPWQSNRTKQGYNTEAQVHLYEAFFTELYHEPWFAGGFIWKWFLDHENVGGVGNNQFTPQNKPVEKNIKEHFKLQQ